MKAIGRNDLVERVHTVQYRAALLESGHGTTGLFCPTKLPYCGAGKVLITF
jgi:hypothetical protein